MKGEIEIIMVEEKKIPYRCEGVPSKVGYGGRLCLVKTVDFDLEMGIHHFGIVMPENGHSWVLGLLNEWEQQRVRTIELRKDVIQLQKDLLVAQCESVWKIIARRFKWWWLRFWGLR